MTSARNPDRLVRAVEILDVAADQHVLEIGCGSGVAVSMVCERLGTGRITGIDRSPTAIARATRRNAADIAAGKAVLRRVELAGLDLPDDSFDTIFGVNVNLFWVRPAGAALATLRRLLRADGRLHLMYEMPPGREPSRTGEVVRSALDAAGFAAAVSTQPVSPGAGSPSLLVVTGRG